MYKQLYRYLLVFCTLSLVAQEKPQVLQLNVAEEQDYHTAIGFFRDSLYHFALQEFESFLQKYPRSIHREEVAFLRVECLFHTQRYGEALREYDVFLRTYSTSPYTARAYFRKGEVLLSQKKYSAAVDAFKTVLEKFPDSEYVGEAAYWVGESYLGDKNYTDALKYFHFSYEQGANHRVFDYALFSLGWTYQQLGNYARAAAWYDSVLVLSPTSRLVGKACIQRAECYAQLRQYENALKALQQCSSNISETDERALVDLYIAEYLYQLERYAEARTKYEEFLAKYPMHQRIPEVHYSIGWTYLKQARYRDAIQVFSRVAEGNSDYSLAALFQVGKTYQLAGVSDSALQKYNELIKIPQQNQWKERAFLEAGILTYEKRQYRTALQYFQPILSIQPPSLYRTDALRWIGECYLSEQRPAEAIPYFTSVVEDTTARSELRSIALFQRGRSYFILQQYGRAVTDFKLFLSNSPKHELANEALWLIAEAEYKGAKYASALQYYQQLAGSDNKQYREKAYYGLGWTYFKQSNYSKAIEVFEKLIAEFSKGTYVLDARLRIADAYYAQKEYKRAVLSYRTVIRMFPESTAVVYAQYQLGQSLYRLQDYAEAYKAFEGLLKQYPKSQYADDALYVMGFINMQRREYNDAIKDFQTLIQKYPTSDILPKALYSLGDCYYNMKNYSAARRTYEEIMQRYPTSEYIPDVLVALYYSYVAEKNDSGIFTVIEEYLTHYSDAAPAERVWMKKAELYELQKNYRKAIEEYSAFLQRYPNSKFIAEVYFQMAHCANELGDKERELQIYTTMLGKSSISDLQKCKARLKLAQLLKTMNRSEEAQKYLLECLHCQDESVVAEATVTLGILHYERGEMQNAQKHFDTVLQNYATLPSSDVAAVARARIALEEKDYSRAERLLTNVATKRKDTLAARAYCLLGDMYRAKEQWTDAIKTYLRVKYLFPSYSDHVAYAYLGLGAAYEALNDVQQARKAYTEILKLQTHDEYLNEAKLRLQKLQ